MAYGRRRYYRRRSAWRRRYSRRFSRRRYRRRFSRSSGTRSRTVKLTFEVSQQTVSTAGGPTSPIFFVPTAVPGFGDYAAVFSSFRILKARLNITSPIGYDGNNMFNFLVVPSRNFAQVTTPVPSGGALPQNFVPPQAENALRQTRYQYQVYPSSVKRHVSVSFKPYTMVSTGGPTAATVDTAFQRIWEGRKWTPFGWLSGNQNDRIIYFGPYIVLSNTEGAPAVGAVSLHGVLTLYCQFRGQK